MADAESSRILRKQNCVLTEATRELAISAVRVPNCSSCPLPITIAPVPPYQDCIITIPYSGEPFSIAISPDSLTAWVLVGNSPGVGFVSRIDQTTNTVTQTINLGATPICIAVDPSNTYVWVTTNDGVFRIEVATNNYIGPIAVGFLPVGIAVSPDNLTVWVSSTFLNSVWYMDTTTLLVSPPILVGTGPGNLVVSPSTVYVINTTSNTVSFINTSTYAVINYPVGISPIDIAISPDYSKLWIANLGSGTISVLASGTGVLLHTITITLPYSLAISRDYSSVWVLNNTSLTKFNALTYAQISVYGISGNPTGVAVNPDNSAVLVANNITVTKFYTPLPPPNFVVEELPVPSSGTALLLLTVIHGRAVDLTSYVRATDGSTLTFILPLNIGGSVELTGSILTVYQTTPYLPITVTSPSSCAQQPGSIILNIVLTVPAFSTPSESNYILSKVAACPLYTLNQIPPNLCLTVAPTFTPPPSETPSPLNPYPYVTTPPNALHQYRSVPRIRGINQIATVVRGQSASEATIRKQTAVLQRNKAPTTTFFRKPVPLTPCVPRFVRPPPYPPAPPCRTKPL